MNMVLITIHDLSAQNNNSTYTLIPGNVINGDVKNVCKNVLTQLLNHLNQSSVHNSTLISYKKCINTKKLKSVFIGSAI